MEKALSKEPFIKWQVFVKCYVLESMQKLQTSYEQNPDRNLLGLVLKHPLHAIVTDEVEFYLMMTGCLTQEHPKLLE